jgi:hypothetical protein
MFTSAALLFAWTSLALGQTGTSDATQNATYSQAVFSHGDPLQFLFDAENAMSQTVASLGYRSPYSESLAAKAALEAGVNDKALSYAVEALATRNSYFLERRSGAFRYLDQPDKGRRYSKFHECWTKPLQLISCQHKSRKQGDAIGDAVD